jgi:hypothetical protein
VGNLKKKYAQGFLAEKLPQQDHTTTTDSEMEEPYLQGRHLSHGSEAFRFCGKTGLTLPFLNVCEGVTNIPVHQAFSPSPFVSGE